MTISNKIVYKTLIISGKVVEYTFDKFTKNSDKVNSNTLLNILSLNSSSEYGLKYNFKKFTLLKSIKILYLLQLIQITKNILIRWLMGKKIYW